MIGIYCIKNLKSGRKYYGSSKQIEERFNCHKKQLIANKHHNILLQRSWNKNKPDDFSFTIVQECAITDLLIIEQTYIDNNIDGYNLAPANGGDILSNHPDRDGIIRRRTATVKATMASLSPEERQEKYGKPGDKNGRYIDGRSINYCPVCGIKIKAGASHCKAHMILDHNGSKNSFYGKTHSAETKKKIIATRKKNNIGKVYKPEDHRLAKKYIATWPSGATKEFVGLKATSEYFKVTMAAISYIVKRGRPNSSGHLKDILIKQFGRP